MDRREVEAALVASTFLYPEQAGAALQAVRPEWLTDHRWRSLWETFQRLYSANVLIERNAVQAELERSNLAEEVGRFWDIDLLAIDCVPYPEHYARLVQEAAARDQAFLNAQRLAQAARSGTPEQLVQLYQEMAKSSPAISLPKAVSLDSLLQGYLDAVRRGETINVRTVLTGIPSLDRLLQFLASGNTYVLAARPGVGKSSLALTIAHNVARRGQHTLYFSLEMSALDLALRALSPYVMLSAARLKRMDVPDHQRLVEAIAQASTKALLLDDTPYPDIAALTRAARQVHRIHPLDFLVVDYVQLLGGGERNRREEIIAISRELKRLSQELDAPILAVAQLSRAAEQEEEPEMRHLAESSALEADASAVIVMWRKEKPTSVDAAYRVHWKVLKNRMGPLGQGTFNFLPQYTLFTEEEVHPLGEEREMLVAALMEQCNALPFTWESWQLSAPGEPPTAAVQRRSVLEQARQIPGHLQKRHWAIIFSSGDGRTTFNYGNGKTHMLHILQAQIIRDLGMPALRINWRLYTEEVKRSWNDKRMPIEWRDYPIVLLDDVDTVRLSNGSGTWHAEMLYDLFELALQRRIGLLLVLHQEPKLFAANLSSYGDVGRSAANRLMTRAQLMTVDFSRVPPWPEVPNF